MTRRFVTIWFHSLLTDWFIIKKPSLKPIPFVLATPDHGRMIITSTNNIARKAGIHTGMAVADARALVPSLEVLDHREGLAEKLLKGIAIWCIRYTPAVAIDKPDGLVLDATGCAHLWGGEAAYINDIIQRLGRLGYHVRAAIADTIGAAWAITHYRSNLAIIPAGEHHEVLLSLPPASLRLDSETIVRLEKLGLKNIAAFINMPRATLQRRFGISFLQRLDQATGREEEIIQTVQPVAQYNECLPCTESISTATGIEIALRRLLDAMCNRLRQKNKGLRVAIFKGYRADGKIETTEIGTNRPSNNVTHLFKLFEFKLQDIEPASGIDLFTLEAFKVEDIEPSQEKLWKNTSTLDDTHLSELLDRLAGKIGAKHIHRYLPDQHYWPERSIKRATSWDEKPGTWSMSRPRPVQLLSIPERIDVTAPIPDYPPMLFRYKGKLHKIVKADGPERIEQEWWLQQGQHRDYYYVEDDAGLRYWLFRSGHYDAAKTYQWFIHGFFA